MRIAIIRNDHPSVSREVSVSFRVLTAPLRQFYSFYAPFCSRATRRRRDAWRAPAPVGPGRGSNDSIAGAGWVREGRGGRGPREPRRGCPLCRRVTGAKGTNAPGRLDARGSVHRGPRRVLNCPLVHAPSRPRSVSWPPPPLASARLPRRTGPAPTRGAKRTLVPWGRRKNKTSFPFFP